jgi:hypothetical protein
MQEIPKLATRSSAGRARPRSCAYALLSAGAAPRPDLSPDEHPGAAGFVINSGWNGALPSAAMNVVWIGIGVYALAQLRKRPQGT